MGTLEACFLNKFKKWLCFGQGALHSSLVKKSCWGVWWTGTPDAALRLLKLHFP